ncbi:hypothetical protein [Mycolicibacterium sp. S2-37]|nr:hypothetical protein [Mycolicibacterium sp. S2-37]
MRASEMTPEQREEVRRQWKGMDSLDVLLDEIQLLLDEEEA